MATTPSPGDTNNALLRKILTSITAVVSDGVLEANRPRPGDTDNVLLRKILTIIAFGTVSGSTSNGTPAAPVIAGSGSPTTITGVEGDVYFDLVNGDVYIYESNTWVLQEFTSGNTWTTGAGAPSDASGRDGDYYLEGTTYALWEKASGVWQEADIYFQRAPSQTSQTYAANITLNMRGSAYVTITLTGDVVFATSNRASTRAIAVKLYASGGDRALSFPGTWVWIGSAAPTSLASGKTAVLSITCFGDNDSDIVAVYAAEQ